ncbi:hypothetical protein KFK14_03235 [Sphingobium phenoxybenzoativorans]|uniref:Tetratricopeptide repeat protein n=1 Tax=Sphingobium phenoxybenzoativorans TaxID=1592790 RepID=A0A975K808_9SPHN|nr:tetratricopeptide repeat protein [Sphingobium phenoxybenzoativorans]QUT06494.1 hypothetical protein KFK14_03235 [Sphingobium phenoxybenzoativorans]
MHRRRLVSIAVLAVASPLISSAKAPTPSAPGMMRLDPASLMATACGFLAPAGEASPAGAGAFPMPLIPGLAPIHYPIATASAEAQQYFDQGMALLYGFEFAKAERSFKAGLSRDANCAMCMWGEALAIGPYLNSGPSGDQRIAAARALTDRALTASAANEKEHALISALAVRYAPGGPNREKGVHAIAFADAMRDVSERYPDDDMIMVLAAEAAMNVQPWNYWKEDGLTPLPWAARAIALVERVLARNPDQPEAQHLYIHLTEASHTPGRAEAAADRLLNEAPASAHLVHMPSHTYYRIGRFDDAISANERAVDVDEAMARTLREDPKFYGYFVHHNHFLTSAAEQISDRTVALRSAANLEAAISPDQAAKSAYIEARFITALQARAQFAGDLAALMAMPAPDARLKTAGQVWRALRAESLARAGRTADAKREIAAMRQARKGAKIDRELQPLITLAETIALSRIAESAGDGRRAIALLQKAERIETSFDYNEPPLWHQPVGLALGGLLLRRGDVKGANAAFDRALARRPGNGWAMWGKAQALAAAGDAEASRALLEKQRKAWRGTEAPTLARL